MNLTGIPWVRNADGSQGHTWNPVIGCTRISPGCGGGIRGPNGEQGGCWAEHLVGTRMSKNPKLPLYHDLTRTTDRGEARWSGFVRMMPERLSQPIAYGKPTTIFVCDMSDLFHDAVPDAYIAAVFGVMGLACHHTYQVLTKRSARAAYLLSRLTLDDCMAALAACPTFDGPTRAQSRRIRDALPPGSPFAAGSQAPLWPLPNVWLGVSVEDRKHGLPRIDHLRCAPAARRFLSVEPLLEDLGTFDLRGIDWAIVGGESGSDARPFDVAWARSIRDLCTAAGGAFFMKQMGSHVRWNGFADPDERWPDTVRMSDTQHGNDGLGWRVGLRDRAGEDPAEWPEDLRVREMPSRVGGVVAAAEQP